jgi:hypothetical protein
MEQLQTATRYGYSCAEMVQPDKPGHATIEPADEHTVSTVLIFARLVSQ